MAWKVIKPSPPTQGGGGTRLITAQAPIANLAELKIQSDVGEAISATFYFGVQGTGNTLAAGDEVVFTIQWGWAGTIFQETFTNNRGKIVRAGDWFILSAQLVNETTTLTSSDSVTVRGMIVPATEADDRWSTLQESGMLQTGNTGLITARSGSTLLAVWGYNYGATNDYLQLFDLSGSTPANGTKPDYVMGYVAAQGSFSYVNKNPGLPFQQAIRWAASSTGATLTLDAGATFALNFEFAKVPQF